MHTGARGPSRVIVGATGAPVGAGKCITRQLDVDVCTGMDVELDEKFIGLLALMRRVIHDSGI